MEHSIQDVGERSEHREKKQGGVRARKSGEKRKRKGSRTAAETNRNKSRNEGVTPEGDTPEEANSGKA